jgi:hypothetical protein
VDWREDWIVVLLKKKRKESSGRRHEKGLGVGTYLLDAVAHDGGLDQVFDVYLADEAHVARVALLRDNFLRQQGGEGVPPGRERERETGSGRTRS